MIFRRKYRVELADKSLLADMRRRLIANNNARSEQGGFIFGHYSPYWKGLFKGEERIITITDFMLCANTKLAKDGVFEMRERDYIPEIMKRFKRGERLIGEWHSHPSGVPVPSPVDDATMYRKKLLSNSKYLMGILSRVPKNDEGFVGGIYVYLYRRWRRDSIYTVEFQ